MNINLNNLPQIKKIEQDSKFIRALFAIVINKNAFKKRAKQPSPSDSPIIYDDPALMNNQLNNQNKNEEENQKNENFTSSNNNINKKPLDKILKEAEEKINNNKESTELEEKINRDNNITRADKTFQRSNNILSLFNPN